MTHQGVNSFGPAVDPQEGLPFELSSDARSAVAEAKARFDVAMEKSDARDDPDASKGARLTNDMT